MPDQAVAKLIQDSKIGAELTGVQCAALAALVQVVEYADGQVVVAEGATDERLRVVLTGALGVAKKSADGDWVRLNVLTAGELAGELAFLDSQPRYAALVALGPTRLLALERTRLESLLETDPLLVYRVMRAVARFAHQVLHRSAWQMAQLTAYVYKTQAKY